MKQSKHGLPILESSDIIYEMPTHWGMLVDAIEGNLDAIDKKTDEINEKIRRLEDRVRREELHGTAYQDYDA